MRRCRAVGSSRAATVARPESSRHLFPQRLSSIMALGQRPDKLGNVNQIAIRTRCSSLGCGWIPYCLRAMGGNKADACSLLAVVKAHHAYGREGAWDLARRGGGGGEGG